MNDGRKDDAGKLGYELLPPDALARVVAVLTHGAAHYGADNWRRVQDGSRRYYAATMRHLEAWRRGVDRDESGHLHLAHAVASLLILLERNEAWNATPESLYGSTAHSEPSPTQTRLYGPDGTIPVDGPCSKSSARTGARENISSNQ